MGWTGYHGGLSLILIVVTVLFGPLYVHARTRYPAKGDVFGYRPFAIRNKPRYELPYMREVRSPGAEFDSQGYYYGDEYQLRRPVKKYRRHKTRRRYNSNRSKYDNYYNYENENDDYQIYGDDFDDVGYRGERPHQSHRYHEDNYDSGPIYGKRRKKYQKPFNDNDDDDDYDDEDRETDLIRDEQNNKNKDDEDDADNDADYDDADDDNDDDDVDVEFHSNKNNTNAVTCNYGNVILYVLSSGKRWSCGKPSKGSTVDNEKGRSTIAIPSLREEPRSSNITKRKRKDNTDYFKLQEQSMVVSPNGHREDIAASSHIKVLQPVKFKRDIT